MEGANPNDIENPHVLVLMEKLERLSPPSPWRCIYRVPDRFRRVRPDDYTPRVISIGPFHHGKEALKAMEVHKMWYVKCFLDRTELKLNDCFGNIKAKEKELRSCYGETIELGSDEFAKIILVDAIFLIEFLHRYQLSRELQDENDCLFGKPMMKADVVPDLLMLENQLPFFILEDLHSSPEIKEQSIKLLRDQGVIAFGPGVKLSDDSNPGVKRKHFIDLLRKMLIASSPMTTTVKSKAAPSIEKLHLAGVKLKVDESTSKNGPTNLFSIQFDNGTLKIPKLQTGDLTELVLRNLIAFEQCNSTSHDYCISDYVSIMDELVNTPRDVELLVKYGIVENNLGGADHELSILINRLSTGIVYFKENYYYGQLCGDLNKFHSLRRAQVDGHFETQLFQHSLDNYFVRGSSSSPLNDCHSNCLLSYNF